MHDFLLPPGMHPGGGKRSWPIPTLVRVQAFGPGRDLGQATSNPHWMKDGIHPAGQAQELVAPRWSVRDPPEVERHCLDPIEAIVPAPTKQMSHPGKGTGGVQSTLAIRIDSRIRASLISVRMRAIVQDRNFLTEIVLCQCRIC